MKKTIIAVLLAASTSAHAETWALGDCTADTGEKIRYAVRDGKGILTINGGIKRDVFTKVDGGIGIIQHIGSEANLTIAVTVKTGRGYIVVMNDDGTKVEGNIWCKLSTTER